MGPQDDLDAAIAPRPAGRPSAARSAKLEQHILDVAWELLAQEGIDGLTIDAIANRGRLSKTTIYARFRGKEALVGAVIEQKASVYLDRVFEPTPTGTLREQARVIAERTLALMMTAESASIERLVASAAHRFPEIRSARRTAFAQACHALTELVLSNPSGTTRSREEVEFLAGCWLHVLTGHVRQDWLLHDGDFDVEAHIARYADKLAGVFLRLLALNDEAPAPVMA